jgi:hypothetical protein
MRKLLDFREAQFQDPDWWLLVSWTTDWVEQTLLNELLELSHDLNLAVMDYSLEQKAFDTHWDRANTIREAVQKHKLPWIETKIKGVSRGETKSLIAQWKAIFGDPEDPEVAKRIELTVLRMRQASQQVCEVN